MTPRRWELIETARKLLLTGWVFIIPPGFALVRHLLGILIQTSHLILLLSARPYKQPSTAVVAVSCSVLLLNTFIVALLVRVYDLVPPALLDGIFGFDSALPLAGLIFGFNFLVLVVALALYLRQVRVEQEQLTQLRLVATQITPNLTLAAAKRWHLFLSHSWANQDVVATIKLQLRLRYTSWPQWRTLQPQQQATTRCHHRWTAE